jgi:fatty-acyl-CoA synthase
VVNTINPRLFPEQLTYIINHAENQYLFVDLSFVGLLESISHSLETVKGIIVLTDKEHMPETTLQNVMCYEELIADESEEYHWPNFDENTASTLCYTSGTTGNPKGVLYSHRSTILHTWIVSSGNVAKISSSSVILPVVPMFHVNAWGIPYATAMFGAKLVLPGPLLDGASIFELIDQEKPDLLMGVPTVWLGLLQYLNETNQTLESVKTALVGGAAAPRAMIQEFEEKHNVFLMHGWGMTEMSPLGTATARTAEMDIMDVESRYDLQQRQGKTFYGVEMIITDDAGKELPKDGEAFGRLLVRGPTVVERYFKSNESALDKNGWFDTGDVAKIHPEGAMEIVDRSKDVIKSGGEWISSIDLENAAVGHPSVAEACVIGVLHKKWDERPLLLVVKVEDQDLSKEEMLVFLEDKVAKWWLPDDVIFVTELPHTATGKLLKTDLRDQYKEHLIK